MSRDVMVTALIFLPLFHNPDEKNSRKPIEDEKFTLTAKEIAEKFGGGILDKTPKKGFWWSKGVLWEDEIAILEVDFPYTKEDRQWLEQYAQEILLKRFEQRAIYIKLINIVEIIEISIKEGSEEGSC